MMKGIIIWLVILTLLILPMALWFLDLILRDVRIFG